jgi:hypothetical protein
VGLFNVVTFGRVADKATAAVQIAGIIGEKSKEGRFVTAGAVRRHTTIYFVFQNSHWDKAEIDEALIRAFPKKGTSMTYEEAMQRAAPNN